MKKLLFFAICFFGATACFAQAVDVKTKIDSAHLMIGSHQQLHILVTAPTQSAISIQPYEQWKLANCEVVEVKPLTSKQKGNKTYYQQDVTLISFDTGVAVVAPIVILQSDTIPVGTTKLVQFHIDSLPFFVDTTAAFKDIKSPMNGEDIEILPDEKSNSNWKKVLLTLVIILLLVGLAVYLYIKYGRKYFQNKKLAALKHQLKENAGQVALNSLKSLKAKKLWQKGMVKDYYSELSMIVRTYISSQWDVNAKEMVTDEIMEAIDELDLDSAQMRELSVLLGRADLVKYAKEQPLIEENEVSYKQACEFVKETDRVERAKMAELQDKKNRK